MEHSKLTEMIVAKDSGRKCKPAGLQDSKWAFSGRVTRKDRGLPETYEKELANSWLWKENKAKESGQT